MEIVQLKKENYDELIDLLNFAFTKNGKRPDFEKNLPKMCIRDDEHMGQHYGIYEDGVLAAVIGVYLLPAYIGGESVIFSTVGNVATRPGYEGRGYMSALFSFSMEKLSALGADASRLGGLRHRYNRYGYEAAGTRYKFSLTSHNVKSYFADIISGVEFKMIERTDKDTLLSAKKMQESTGFFVKRGEGDNTDDVYFSMVAWQNVPYAAMRDGKMIGYVSVSPDGAEIAESYAESTEALAATIAAWQARVEMTVKFIIQPHQLNEVRLFSSVCESFEIASPNRFKIISWEKIVGALMRLKASYTNLSEGELTLNIEGFGGLRLFVSDGEIGCEKYHGECEISLSSAAASRYLFGPLPPETVASVSPAAASWLPLPLSWNMQDRV